MGTQGRQSGGPVGNANRRPERMALGGNAYKGSGTEKLGSLGEVGTADVWGWEPTVGSRMGNNGPHPKREGWGLGYRTRRGGVEVLCNSGELSVGEGVSLARSLARVQIGAGNGDGHTGCQFGSTACGTRTRATFSSIFGHPQGI